MEKFYIALLSLALLGSTVQAEEYAIDNGGMHASIQFKVSHLGYGWVSGRFNDFKGTVNYDNNNPSASKIEVTIATASVDSNHALRDKHLRSEDFLVVDKFPEAKFVSTSFTEGKDGAAIVEGNLTLRGVTKAITIDAQKLGEGKDPWGGYRIGFEGSTKIAMADFGITKNLGPTSMDINLIFSFEAIKK